MSKGKLIIIIYAILALIVLAVLSILLFVRFSRPEVPTTIPSPTESPINIPLPTGETVEVSGVPIKNPYISPVELSKNADSLMVRTDKYDLVYIKPYEQFLITINASPFESNRLEAEQAFLERLEISQEEACSLNVFVSTPYSVNPDESGTNYRLSFCE